MAGGLQAKASPASFEGIFNVVYGDGQGESHRQVYFLAIGGRSFDLVPAPGSTWAERAADLDRGTVVVEGIKAGDTIHATSVRLAPGAEVPSPSFEGSKAYATILCKFPDIGSIPHDAPWYSLLMGPAYPGMDHYWRATSYGAIDLVGSNVFGWFRLPNPYTYYLQPDGNLSLDLLFEDCTAIADSQVFYPDYYGINLMFNASLGCCAWGGGRVMGRDGQVRGYGVTWMPPWGQTLPIMGHEMGHSVGFPHSSGPYSQTYDSRWDQMSAASSTQNDPVLGPIPVTTVSHHRNLDAWIDPSRRYTAAVDSVQTIRIQPLGDAIPTLDYQMGIIPIRGGESFYSVEVRRHRGGYDESVPFEGVLLHHVDPTRGDRDAQVVDPDGDGDPNDESAIWVPGEVFENRHRGARVEVLSSNADGSYTIQVAYDPPWIQVDQSGGSTAVAEGGISDSFAVALESAPTAPVTIALTTQGEVALVPSVLTFTTANWSVPQAVTVTAIDDTQEEPLQHADQIDFAVTSADEVYDGWQLPPVGVTVTDNDGVAPETTITAGPPELTYETSARFAFKSNELGTFECALDGPPFVSCVSPTTYVDLNDGSHELRVRAVDAAGYIDASPAVWTWRIDSTAPAIQITRPNGGVWVMDERLGEADQTIVVGPVTVEATASHADGIASFVFEVDGVPVPAADVTRDGDTYRFVYRAALPGLHDVVARARTQAGREESRSLTLIAIPL